MNKADIVFELSELETPLRLARVAVNKGYLTAAASYLEEIEAEAVRLRQAIHDLPPQPKLTAANLLHPNDPAFEPYHE